MALTDHRFVCVEWCDAVFQPEETKPEGFLGDFVLTSCGIVAGETERTLSLGHALQDGRFRWILHIPKGLIRQIRELGVAGE